MLVLGGVLVLASYLEPTKHTRGRYSGCEEASAQDAR